MKKFIAGMVKDPERVDQPEGTYRDALNANLYYQKGAIVNEHGTVGFNNKPSHSIESVIGSCPLKDGRIVLFYNTTIGQQPTCAISVVNPITKLNKIIYHNPDLNFQTSNTIEATSKIDINGNFLVYFTDNYIKRAVESATGIEYIREYNPPRVINITRQEENTIISNLYGNSEYTVEKLDLFLNAGFIPEFGDVSIEEGGGVVSGTYHLAVAYVDEDLNKTNYLSVSNPVHLVTAYEDSIPTETITGDPQGSQSNKSINWAVNVPAPSNYTHIQPVVIQRFGGGMNQESSEFAYELPIVKLDNEVNGYFKIDVTYTGLESISSSSVAEIVIDSVRYETAKTFVQLDGRLYISNLTSRGDIGYQRFANSINLIPVIKRIERFDPKRFNSIILNRGYFNTSDQGQHILLDNDFDIYKDLQKNYNDDFSGAVRKGYKDVKLSHKYRGYRRSEVYAFYISFVLKNGTETYAYHIPGREKIRIGELEETQLLSDNTAMAALSFDSNAQEFSELFPEAELYQAIDTELLLNGDTLSYWENKDETYPDTEDFDVYTVVNGAPELVGNIRNANVRHHKMPSNKGSLGFIAPTPEVQPNIDENITYAMVLKETVKILGIKLTNIPIPDFIKEQVQGFKIYYAKREQEHKTIIGQSVLLPAWYESPVAPTYDPELAAYSAPNDAWMFKGHIPIHPRFYPEITNSIYGNERSRALTTFGFHDFNLLKNKYTLSGASHIDVQRLLVMRSWTGGPKNKAANGSIFFRDVDWSNSNIGYSWSYYDDDTSDWLINGTSKVTKYYTSILIAQQYLNPYTIGSPVLMSASIPNNYSTILTIEPNSKTYMAGGKTTIKNVDSMAFSNVDYLLNYAGETCMAFGLSSGLPFLYGATRRNVESNLIWFHDYFWSIKDDGDTDGSTELVKNDVTKNLLPTLYLSNLCAYKTNVYKPFDQQKLVWTGYYQPIASAKPADDNINIYESEDIFGGDTYISRYGFRHTSEDYNFSYHKDYDKQNPALLPNAVSSPDPTEWKAGTSNPYSSVYYFLTETDDLLGFRHQQDQSAGVDIDAGMYFDASIGSKVLFNNPLNDNTKQENLLYMNNYSAVQDIKTAVPLPKKLVDPKIYPTRTIRSNADGGVIQDKYRIFAALDYKDIARNRGEITKLFTLGSILYLHTERSLFVTRGRQQLGLSDGTQAFVGTGDVFEQNPDELIPTTEGYGGTDCQFASLTTRYGQFFVNRKDRKVYMMAEGISEVSSLGMEKWFLDNIPYQIENYVDIELSEKFDAPTKYFGFTAAYDPKYKRILLSKREAAPTQILIDLLEDAEDVVSVEGGIQFFSPRSGQTIAALFDNLTYFVADGWTLSYYPEVKVWGSRHSYSPRLLTNTQKELYSLINSSDANLQVWEHSDDSNPGKFYGDVYPFEFEFIDNSDVGSSKVFTNIRYWTEIFSKTDQYTKQVNKHIHTGFDEFYVYNSNQLSGSKYINYLTNARLVDKWWYINDFRDMSKVVNSTAPHFVTGIPNVQNNMTDEVFIPTSDSMFLSEGNINPDYLNLNKHWFEQKKFTDHYLGVRLISNNLSSNLIYLYSAGTKFRQSFR